MTRPIDGDSLLWNWARWCWSGTTVGNMARYRTEKDVYESINDGQALVVDSMHRALPHHEAMIITAEYPQRNVRFADLGPVQRQAAARRWIGSVTGVWLTVAEYELYLGFFRNAVARRLLK